MELAKATARAELIEKPRNLSRREDQWAHGEVAGSLELDSELAGILEHAGGKRLISFGLPQMRHQFLDFCR